MIREPAVAGQFYPGSPRALQKSVESYLSPPDTLLEARAVVSPHAGYMYSGSVAGAIFSAVKLPKRFIVLGPNHTGRGERLAISPVGEWHTPLGMVPIDADLHASLLKECPLLRNDLIAHTHEHSLEVQLPFLQILAPGCTFVGICVGTTDYKTLESLGHAMARVIQSCPEPVLMVASSDMNHYESAQVAQNKDRQAIDRFLALDPPGLHRVVIEKDITMCGFAPTVAVLTACVDLGATRGHIIRYTNSGEVSGDFDRVVAYAGLAVT